MRRLISLRAHRRAASSPASPRRGPVRGRRQGCWDRTARAPARRAAASPADSGSPARRPLADQHDLPLDLVLHAVQKRRRARPAVGRSGSDQVIGRARSPCPLVPGVQASDLARQLILDRRDDVRRKALVDPARVAEVPRLEVAVGQAPARHLLDRPLARPPCGSAIRSPAARRRRSDMCSVRMICEWLASSWRIFALMSAFSWFLRRSGGLPPATQGRTTGRALAMVDLLQADPSRSSPPV